MLKKIASIVSALVLTLAMGSSALAAEAPTLPSEVEITDNVVAAFDLTNPEPQTQIYTDSDGNPVEVRIERVAPSGVGLRSSAPVYAADWYISANFVSCQMSYYITVNSSLNITNSFTPYFWLLGSEMISESLTHSSKNANYHLACKGLMWPFVSASYNLPCRISGSTLYVLE